MASASGTAGYGTRAADLAAQYESITFEDVHRDVLHLFPTEHGHVLDIGAGSGRDAAALALLGIVLSLLSPRKNCEPKGKGFTRCQRCDGLMISYPNCWSCATLDSVLT